MLTGPEESLIGIESDLVLLHVRVDENHALDLVLYAVLDKVVFEDQLLTEHEPEVDLSQELIQELIVLSYQVIQYVLEYRPDLNEREHIVLPQLLLFLVGFAVESQVFHGHARVGSSGLWVTECRECIVAFLNDELEVVLASLVIEDEVLLATDAEPV